MLQEQSAINEQLQLETPGVLRQNIDVENRSPNTYTRKKRTKRDILVNLLRKGRCKKWYHICMHYFHAFLIMNWYT